jgi:hypothetical protein
MGTEGAVHSCIAVTGRDHFDICVVLRTAHDFCTNEKEVLTHEDTRQKTEMPISLKVGDMGFRRGKSKTNRQIVTEIYYINEKCILHHSSQGSWYTPMKLISFPLMYH